MNQVRKKPAPGCAAWREIDFRRGTERARSEPRDGENFRRGAERAYASMARRVASPARGPRSEWRGLPQRARNQPRKEKRRGRSGRCSHAVRAQATGRAPSRTSQRRTPSGRGRASATHPAGASASRTTWPAWPGPSSRPGAPSGPSSGRPERRSRRNHAEPCSPRSTASDRRPSPGSAGTSARTSARTSAGNSRCCCTPPARKRRPSRPANRRSCRDGTSCERPPGSYRALPGPRGDAVARMGS
jgi:hypothetical protein